jgi:hypothetical protein
MTCRHGLQACSLSPSIGERVQGPAYIYPGQPRKEPNFGYRLLRAIYPAFRVLFPNQVIRADDLARAMVDAAVRRTGEPGGLVLENRDIRALREPPRLGRCLLG